MLLPVMLHQCQVEMQQLHCYKLPVVNDLLQKFWRWAFKERGPRQWGTKAQCTETQSESTWIKRGCKTRWVIIIIIIIIIIIEMYRLKLSLGDGYQLQLISVLMVRIKFVVVIWNFKWFDTVGWVAGRACDLWKILHQQSLKVIFWKICVGLSLTWSDLWEIRPFKQQLRVCWHCWLSIIKGIHSSLSVSDSL